MTRLATSRSLQVLLLCVAVGAAAATWWAQRQAGPVVVESRPLGVMGTGCSLVAVLEGDGGHRGAAVLGAAEDELRRLEGLLSTWIEASEISRLNRAAAGAEVELSADSRAVLRLARQLHRATGGAFDITAGPLIDGWRRAADERRLPEAEELTAWRALSRWPDLEVTGRGAVKARGTVRVDIDGIAKGYAIDRALAAMRRAGAVGGMVEVGGDLRVFGEAPGGVGWTVGVWDPSLGRARGTFRLAEGAACTSGGYARFVEIDGRRYSHILDPASGRPAEAVVSATVVAADAATADAWATALAVKGPAGLGDLPPGVEALLLLAGTERPRGVATPAFPPIAGDEAPLPDRAG